MEDLPSPGSDSNSALDSEEVNQESLPIGPEITEGDLNPICESERNKEDSPQVNDVPDNIPPEFTDQSSQLATTESDSIAITTQKSDNEEIDHLSSALSLLVTES